MKELGEEPQALIKEPKKFKLLEHKPLLKQSTIPSCPVEVRSAEFSFKKIRVLDGIDLTVRKGIIYALLGPSGCGKTTLLNSLVCLRTLDKGEVKIFGAIPGSKKAGVPGRWVGFMPQDICLYDELTIEQTLLYFGRILLVGENYLKSRTRFLMKFLDLPNPDRLVRTLSGGQARRLSLAVVLIHRPPLLLLDEPTVGLDPLLRKTLWDHMLQMVREEETTILLTTHYIEEARKADVVGFMRQGRILVESNPEKLIRDHNSVSLEQVFLKFCLEESNSRNFENQRQDKQSYLDYEDSGSISKVEMEFEDRPSSSLLVKVEKSPERIELLEMQEPEVMNFPLPVYSWKEHLLIVLAVTYKTMLRLRRNLLFVFMSFFLPTVCVILARNIVGNDPEFLPFGIVSNEDPPDLSQTFMDGIDNKLLLLKKYQQEEEALVAVREGTVFGAIFVGASFSENAFKRFQEGVFCDNQTVRDSTVHVRMGTGEPVVLFAALRAFEKGVKHVVSKMVADAGVSKELENLPLRFQTPIFGGPDPTYMSYILPGLMCATVYITSFICACAIFTDEFERGNFHRNKVSGVSTFHLIVSHLLVQLLPTVFQVSAMLIIIVLYNMNLNGSLLLVSLLLFIQNGLAIAQGLLVSVIGRRMQPCLAVMVILNTLDLIISGTMWTIESMPHSLRYVTFVISPCSAIGRALKLVLWKGLGLAHSHVWMALLLNYFWITFALLGVVIILHRIR